MEGHEILINAISFQIKRGLLAKNANNQLKIFERICKEFGLVALDAQDIFDMAAEIYADLKQKGELVEDADILMASVAIYKSFTLVSDDTEFNRIQDLKVEKWLY